MAPKKNETAIVQSKDNIANQLRALADGIENGQISRYEITHASDGRIAFMADSSDGQQRIISEEHSLIGLHRNTTEHIIKLSRDQRLKTVQDLTKQGMSQSEIARRTMVSQKTISNDLKSLSKNKYGGPDE